MRDRRWTLRGAIGATGAVVTIATAVLTVTVGAPPAAAAPPAGSSRFVPFGPTRLVDSRHPGQTAMLGPVGDNTSVPIQVTGQAGLPATGISAVVVNITLTATTAPGYVQAYPTGQTPGASSNLNVLGPGQVMANLAVVPLGNQGRISIYLEHRSELIVDVVGYFTPVTTAVTAGRYVPLTPERILDTRSGLGASGPGPMAVDTSRKLVVAGRAGIPANATAVAMNLTVTGPTTAGFVAAIPSNGAVPPSTSSLNVERAGQTRANLTIVPLGPDGAITVYAHLGGHVLVDVAGYLTAAAPSSTAGLFVPLTPARLLDTRNGLGYSGPKPAAGSVIEEPVLGRAGVPASGVAAVAASVTATLSAGPGFVTAWPAGIAPPVTSTLNMSGAGETVPNAALIKLGPNGAFDLTTSISTHLLTDVAGYFLAASPTPTPDQIDTWAYWGHLYADGTFDASNGRWTYNQNPHVFPESEARFQRGAARNGITVVKLGTGRWETRTTPHPAMPDLRGAPDWQLEAFLSAVVEDEGDACSGLIDDDPDRAHLEYIGELLTQLGVTWRLETSGGGTFWSIFARKATWGIVQAWPYATTARTPGVGTLVC